MSSPVRTYGYNDDLYFHGGDLLKWLADKKADYGIIKPLALAMWDSLSEQNRKALSERIDIETEWMEFARILIAKSVVTRQHTDNRGA